VYACVALPWREIDLRATPAADRPSALERVLEDDRAAGLRFDRAPLMRLTLVRLADTEYELIWTHHHAVLDRWSWLLVLEDVGAIYAALREARAPNLPPAPSFAAYVAWLGRQDAAAAERFWRSALSGLPPTPRLRPPDAASHPSAEDEITVELRLGRDRVRALRALAASMATPLNSVLLYAWTLTLSHVLGADDLVVGIVESGRPDDLDDADRIVGPMVANVPLRVRVASEATLADAVREITRAQFELRTHAWVAPERIEEWSGLAGRLFETLVVFQDASADVAARRWVGDGATVSAVITPTRTEFPVTLVVGGSDEIVISLHVDARRVADSTIRRVLPILDGMLQMFLTDAVRVADVVATLAATDRGCAAERGAAVAEPAADDAEPERSALEQVLADMWRDVLGVSRVRASDTFFTLGGNSLAAMKLSSRIAELLRVRLPLRAVFGAPTIDRLADAVRANAREPGAPDRIAELVVQVSAMSDGEVGSTLSGRQRAAVTGIAE
jgi:acyl carrier protein